MASLRTMVGRFRNELREGVAYVAFWKNGRIWGTEAFWLDPRYNTIEEDDTREMWQIINTDPNAIIVNGFESCPFDGKSTVEHMLEHIRWRYESHRCQLVDFYKGHCKVKDEFEAQPIITAKRKDAEPEAKKQESPQLMEAKELEHLQELTPTEDKQRICSALASVLRLTRNLYDLAYLHYDPGTETVKATFLNGHTKTVNVALDSGTAMIRDIIQQIV
nr:MAG TPA: Large polyvalent-protein-associated domain 15 [Caudoviricetes sp.]